MGVCHDTIYDWKFNNVKNSGIDTYIDTYKYEWRM